MHGNRDKNGNGYQNGDGDSNSNGTNGDVPTSNNSNDRGTLSGNDCDDLADNNNHNGRNPNERDGNSSSNRDYYGQSYEASSRDHENTGKGFNLAKDKFIQTYNFDTLKAIKAFETRAYNDKAIKEESFSGQA